MYVGPRELDIDLGSLASSIDYIRITVEKGPDRFQIIGVSPFVIFPGPVNFSNLRKLNHRDNGNIQNGIYLGLRSRRIEVMIFKQIKRVVNAQRMSMCRIIIDILCNYPGLTTKEGPVKLRSPGVGVLRIVSQVALLGHYGNPLVHHFAGHRLVLAGIARDSLKP